MSALDCGLKSTVLLLVWLCHPWQFLQAGWLLLTWTVESIWWPSSRRPSGRADSVLRALNWNVCK